MERYAGDILQAATKAKNDKKFEGRIAVGIGRFTLERDSEHEWARLVVDKIHVVTHC